VREKILDRDNEAGGAKSTLHRTGLDKRLLNIAKCLTVTN
jgi:hypothetical protein